MMLKSRTAFARALRGCTAFVHNESGWVRMSPSKSPIDGEIFVGELDESVRIEQACTYTKDSKHELLLTSARLPVRLGAMPGRTFASPDLSDDEAQKWTPVVVHVALVKPFINQVSVSIERVAEAVTRCSEEQRLFDEELSKNGARVQSLEGLFVAFQSKATESAQQFVSIMEEREKEQALLQEKMTEAAKILAELKDVEAKRKAEEKEEEAERVKRETDAEAARAMADRERKANQMREAYATNDKKCAKEQTPNESTRFTRALEQWVQTGDTDTLVSIGRYLELGYGGAKRDVAEAFKCYESAASLGSARGQVQLGCCYETSRGVPSEIPEEDRLREAFSLYEVAANAGSSQAKAQMGACYLKGIGCDKDRDLALQLLNDAASGNCGYASALLGDEYAKTKEMKKAIEHYQKSVQQGSRHGCIELVHL